MLVRQPADRRLEERRRRVRLELDEQEPAVDASRQERLHRLGDCEGGADLGGERQGERDSRPGQQALELGEPLAGARERGREAAREVRRADDGAHARGRELLRELDGVALALRPVVERVQEVAVRVDHADASTAGDRAPRAAR